VEIPAKVDYAVRAMAELAARPGAGPVKAEFLAESQDIPEHFLKAILRELGRGGLVIAQRGANGGYRLARPAAEITVADVVRAVHGPLATVRGERPENLEYTGAAEHLAEVWVVLRASMRSVLEHVTIEQLVDNELAENLASFSADPDAWRSGHTRGLDAADGS
jgi:Rrf2 family protein